MTAKEFYDLTVLVTYGNSQKIDVIEKIEAAAKKGENSILYATLNPITMNYLRSGGFKIYDENPVTKIEW